MADAVKLPPNENLNEWIAVNTVDFFNEISLVFSTIEDSCTCSKMTAGEEYNYLWQDNAKFQTPTELPAADYVDNLLTWAESQINDDAVFPLSPSTPFPKDFKKRVSTIYRRFLRVYAHIYCHHIEEITSIGASQHLDSCFQHFYLFVKEFGLVPQEELAPLQHVIDAIEKK
eukprot:UN01986